MYLLALFHLFTWALSVEAPLHISEDGTICYGLSDTSYAGPLVIPEGVKIIWERAFKGNTNLTSLKLPQSLEEIQREAFNSCSALTGSLVIPDSVTGIGQSVFTRCTGFDGTLTLGKSVTRIGGWAFSYCSGLTGSLAIPDSVTEIGDYAFYSCNGFKGTLTLGKSVKYIGICAFQECSGFTGSLTIPDSVTLIYQNAFLNCRGLTEVHVGRQITQITSNAFYGCSLLMRCFFYNSNVTIDTYAFAACTELHIFYEVNECQYFTIDPYAFTGGPMLSNFVCLTPPQLPPTSFFTKVMFTHNSRFKTLQLASVLYSL